MIAYSQLNLTSQVQHACGSLESKYFKICTDSRNMVGGEIFICLQGERFDAFDYREEILRKGTSVFVYQWDKKKQEIILELHKKYKDVYFIGVTNALIYLQTLAQKHISNWRDTSPLTRKIIAITGSNGKTTSKEMLFHLLNSIVPGKVHSTFKNFNNHIGVPLTILDLENTHQFIILEVGTNHPGELKVLCDIAKPNCGLITNIGDSHLEFFKDREGVFTEKRVVYDSIQDNAGFGDCFVINMDDPFLSRLAQGHFGLTLGQNQGDVLIQITNTSLDLPLGSKRYKVKNYGLLGIHNYHNLAMTLTLANRLLPGHEAELIEAARQFRPSHGRSVLKEHLGKLYFVDAYNANPSSMKSSFMGFYQYLKDENRDLDQTLFVFGDMNELGDSAPLFHQELAHFLNPYQLSAVIFVGRYAKDFLSGVIHKNKVRCFDSTEQLKSQWDEIILPFKHVFLKGSNSLQLESLLGIKKTL